MSTNVTAEYIEVDASTFPEWAKFGTCTRDGKTILVLANGKELLEAAIEERKELTLDEAEKIFIEDEGIPVSEAVEEAFHAVGSLDPHVHMDLIVLDENAFKIEAWIWAGAEVVVVSSDEFHF